MKMNTEHPKFDLASELLCSLTTSQLHAVPIELLAEDLFGSANKWDDVIALIKETRIRHGIIVDTVKGQAFVSEFDVKKFKTHTNRYWKRVYNA